MTGVQFGTPAPDLHLYSDASCSGWGAHLLDQHVSGVWSDQEKLLYINRETAPLLLACPGSPGRLRGCVLSSLRGPGSVRVPSLSSDRSGDRPCLRVISSRDDSGRTPLAREGVVRRPSASADPTSLLRQPHCNLFHQGVHALNLHAWRLSSVTSESRAFREGLLESCQGVSDPPPRASTSRGGRSSVVGVVGGALLQSTPLFQ